MIKILVDNSTAKNLFGTLKSALKIENKIVTLPTAEKLNKYFTESGPLLSAKMKSENLVSSYISEELVSELSCSSK